MAGGVRVEVAQQRRPAGARGLVRGDQRQGVELEMAERIGGDIGAGDGGGDVLRAFSRGAEQQPAGLGGVGALRFCAKCGHGATCHCELAPHLANMNRGERIVNGVIAAGGRLDSAVAAALAGHAGLSRERIKALIGEGRVMLGGQVVSQPSLKVEAGAAFSLRVPEPTAASAEAQDIALVIAYEDEHLVVVDKPAGLVVHPAAGNLDGTLVNALLHHCARNGGGQLSGIGGVVRPGIVHRIDKDTSGLLVVAKTDAAHEGLARQFADHSLERAYLAVTGGVPVPASGTITGNLGRSDANRKKMAIVRADRGKHAVTHYRTLQALGAAALVECRLETGRTHQVRVHMASIGHALLGDPLYGRTPKALRPILDGLGATDTRPQGTGFHRQALHAAVLGFIHPVTTQALRFKSELPEDMRELLAALDAE